MLPFLNVTNKRDLIRWFNFINTWFGLSSYLYFLENNFAIEIFTANDTIAILIASPNISGTIDIGGKVGAGILNIKWILNSKLHQTLYKSLPSW